MRENREKKTLKKTKQVHIQNNGFYGGFIYSTNRKVTLKLKIPENIKE